MEFAILLIHRVVQREKERGQGERREREREGERERERCVKDCGWN